MVNDVHQILGNADSTFSSSSPWARDIFYIDMINPDSYLTDLLKDKNPHPSLQRLSVLVLSAVLEVVCVAFPGYLLARNGMFDHEAQKFLANLNIMLFTPCLIFSKIASQLTPDKLPELAIIPVIFVIQTLVCFIVSKLTGKIFRLKKRPSFFLTAMSVFGNSNSLPISLVISLSKTIPSLRWDRIPHDNSDEVAARGILYLMIFQQLGQLVRWSWGYHYLLAKPEKFSAEEGGSVVAIIDVEEPDYSESDSLLSADANDSTLNASPESSESALLSPPPNPIRTSPSDATLDELHHRYLTRKYTENNTNAQTPKILVQGPSQQQTSEPAKWYNPKTWLNAIKILITSFFHSISASVSKFSLRLFSSLPPSLQSALKKSGSAISKIYYGVKDFMNPPLYAMIAAVVVASIPRLHHYFFTKGHFINSSVTRAIEQSGGVAVPLILVVLGSNLAKNTIPVDEIQRDDPKIERKLVILSLVCRMLIPTIIMTPVLAIFAKYVPVSILDDPVFVVVAFLLTGAPPALQLAQICQINGTYIQAMTSILFQAYVIWILPSTLSLVMIALEVVKWAQAS